MLIDIFARRYREVQLRDSFEARDSRLIVQAFRIIADDIYPYYRDGKEDPTNVAFWTELHSRLSRELGVQQLSDLWFWTTNTWNGNETRSSHKWSMVKVCENWMMKLPAGSPDEHIKDRLSLIELGFREREAAISALNAAPVHPLEGFARTSLRVPGDPTEGAKAWRATRTKLFQASVEELNARFRQAGYGLHYHNGFIQASSDALIQDAIEGPFWLLIADSRWVNVDTDMKEALDRRDSDGRDPSFYAARALESVIKIICGLKGWTTGKENGAHNFIDRLGAKQNLFIHRWEADALKAFFSAVRNPLGHGPGGEKMPELTKPQTEWAIEFSMSWIKSLIRRL